MKFQLTNETYGNKLRHGEVTNLVRTFMNSDKSCLNIDCDTCDEAKQIYANIQTFRRRSEFKDKIKVHLSTDKIHVYKI